MLRKTLVATTILFMLIISASALIVPASAATTSTAPQLKIYASPSCILADNQVYSSIFVQIQNSKGAPIRATEDTVISLTSSLTNVGTVDPTITILKGSTYAVGNFYATYTPGATTITAASSGYTTVQATITTNGPMPSTLALYGCPTILPADGETYNALVVQLQDSSGSPAPAPIEGIEVTLSSSNSTIAAVDPKVIIEAGKTYAVASIKTSFNKTGSASITSIASGYSSKQVTITTQNMTTTQPTSLKIYLGPPKVLADGAIHQLITVQLQNASSKIAYALEPITVTLSSSSEDVGTADETITILQGKSYATGTFSTTYKSGTTTITAAATNCTSNQATLTTVGPTPTKLVVYCSPASLPADEQSYEIIQVQLQDSRGKPAKDPLGEVVVSLFSSSPEAGNTTTTIIIPSGKTESIGTFYTTSLANVSTITAQASGYSPGTAKITTYLIDAYTLNMSITTDSESVLSNSQTTVRVYVTYNGSAPASKVNLAFNSTKSANFTSLKEEGNGYYTVTFNTPKVTKATVCNITANATKTGYTSTVGMVQITINPNPINLATLQFQVLEENGNPVSDAIVTSQIKPSGAATLSGVTNASGYVVFTNAIEGNYTMEITKSGYQTETQTIKLGNQPVSYTFNLTKAGSDMTWIIIVVIAVIIVVAIILFLFIRKRRNAAEEDEPQPVKVSKRKKKTEESSL